MAEAGAIPARGTNCKRKQPYTMNQNIYGVLCNGVHIDVSKTERGAKNYATRNGYLTVTVRYNCGYIAQQIAHKYTGKWKAINNN